jgi:REP element-mobilizing transposase RayT
MPPENKKYRENNFSAYGGTLRKTRMGRRGPRPISTNYSMHLVLRSSQARGTQSFFKPKNRNLIGIALKKHSKNHKIKILRHANVGNHLHLHIQVTRRSDYIRFIRAIAGHIALGIKKTHRQGEDQKNFWDHRPFTKIISTFRYLQNIKEYISINQLEGQGLDRINARLVLAQFWDQKLQI